MNVFIGRIDHAPESKLASTFARVEEGGVRSKWNGESPTGKSFRFVRASRRGEAACAGERNDPSVAGAKSRQMFLLTGVLRLPSGVPSGVLGSPGGPLNLLVTRRVVVQVYLLSSRLQDSSDQDFNRL